MRILLLLIPLFLASGVTADTLRLTSGEWPPFHGAELPSQGVATRIINEAFALEGIEVQWEFLPWARSLQLAAQGQRAGTAVWRRNADRERLFFYQRASTSHPKLSVSPQNSRLRLADPG
jgi:polar amino acid transport system substrate-binding protein